MKYRSRRLILLSLVALLGTVALPNSAHARPAVDWGYNRCPAANSAMLDAGMVFRDPYAGNRNTFRIAPTNWARNADLPDGWTDDEFWRCYPSVLNFNVRSWQAIYDQWDCHDYAPPGGFGGATYDLEGHRGATRNLWTWVRNQCNW